MQITEIRPSPGKGRGVFALRCFEAGELIERAPVVVIPEGQWEKFEKTILFNATFVQSEKKLLKSEKNECHERKAKAVAKRRCQNVTNNLNRESVQQRRSTRHRPGVRPKPKHEHRLARSA